jgi:hypothetical protein
MDVEASVGWKVFRTCSYAVRGLRRAGLRRRRMV